MAYGKSFYSPPLVIPVMFKINTLKNKAQVILAPRKETEAVTLLVMFRVGSRYEAKPINGISHFIEHLFFKGTTKRPSTLILSQELDRVGASFNAFTGKDYTGYYIKVAKDNIELAFDILSDMLFNSLFDPQEIKREKGVIVEEIRMYRDNPLFYIGDLLESIAYQGHSLAWEIAGPEAVINKISRPKIIAYLNSHYHPQNMIIGVAGNYNVNTVRKLLNKYFDKKFGKNLDVNKIVPFQSKQSKPRVKLQFKKTNQAQLALGFNGVGRKDPGYITQIVLAVILGGNMSSRLFIKVRERHGLAYSIMAGIDEHKDTGLFYINAGLKRDKIGLAYKLIVNELKTIKRVTVPRQELTKVKDFLKGKLILSLEDSSNYINWLLKQEIDFGKINTINHLKKQIDQVTAKQVQALAQELFNQDKLNLAIIGPYKNSSYFNKLISKQNI